MTKLTKQLRIKRKGQDDLVLSKGTEVTSSIVGKKQVLAYVEEGSIKQVVVTAAEDQTATLKEQLVALKAELKSSLSNLTKDSNKIENINSWTFSKFTNAFLEVSLDMRRAKDVKDLPEIKKGLKILNTSIKKVISARKNTPTDPLAIKLSKVYVKSLDSILKGIKGDNYNAITVYNAVLDLAAIGQASVYIDNNKIPEGLKSIMHFVTSGNPDALKGFNPALKKELKTLWDDLPPSDRKIKRRGPGGGK